MMQLPRYFFRARDNGATVFRVDTENRNGRIEMMQIARINVNRQDYKAHGDYDLTDADIDAITGWLQDRTKLLDERAMDDVERAIDQINQVAQWVQSDASAADLDRVSDRLLLAMHDLRGVLVRRKAEGLTGEDDDEIRK